jgi:hypothetical protein
MPNNPELQVRIGCSTAETEEQAVRELHDQIAQPDMKFALFFCSPRFDLGRLGELLKQTFPCPALGCTTAGEITTRGYQQGGLVGASLSGTLFHAHCRVLFPLSALLPDHLQEIAASVRAERRMQACSKDNSVFGILLVDGLSMLEEKVAAWLFSAFDGVPIVGGSAGDDLRFERTGIYADGRFLSDAAAFCLVETRLPFWTFRTHHFEPGEERLVITEADPTRRRVMEINGEPAALSYAESLGLGVEDLGPAVFSKHPLMLKIGGEYYVRSIQKASEDGSLTFYCAIDNGLVLRVGRGVDLVGNFQSQLSQLEQKIAKPRLILGFDCILRRLEIQGKDLFGEMNGLLKRFPFIGFSTYGEQFNSIHVNQTLTGVVLGDGP